MSRVKTLVGYRTLPYRKEGGLAMPPSVRTIMHILGVHTTGSGAAFIESLPFSLDDTTSGTESELQAVVIGKRSDIDLPRSIEQSNYYANIIKRSLTGETPKRLIGDLERYLSSSHEDVWENSWVRFPLGTLSPFAQETFERDLLADKCNPQNGFRKDIGRFLYTEGGVEYARVPVSYLIKLSLADVLGSQTGLPANIRETGCRLLAHFSNDNTSPETYSFHVVPIRPDSDMGRAIAVETSRRFLLTHLVAMYANDGFTLRSTGQEVLIYFAPHTPLRQRELNDCISDAFYRELFMSPCLAGWDRGEEKHSYMELCHQVLSRSQLNAVAKLREAGIITNNLVILPSVSNTSLANNGTHLSIGSVRLTESLKNPSSGLGAVEEKYVGDLVIKIVEHFLPLFVGTYSAAPYRLGFRDLHPERCLGFLPHELDYTHLRMIWRRWKKKMRCKFLGHPLTPFGPEWLDRLISGLLRFKGDFILDFRLIDYFVALMSTERSPALDGTIGSGDRLKKDLSDLGVFDSKMALYMLYRLRECSAMGFSGFEGRHYSLFHSLHEDMSRAADLQTLVSALAFKYIAQGRVSHAHIPDTPFIESERRQIFFGASIGIPTFFIRKETGNAFLRRIIERTNLVRASRRYPGYVRVYNSEYRKALVSILRQDGSDLIDLLSLQDTILDLEARIEDPESLSAGGKLTRGILEEINARSPFGVGSRDFNIGAERYYRETLRRSYLEEAFDQLMDDILRIHRIWLAEGTMPYAAELRYALGEGDVLQFLGSLKSEVLDGKVSLSDLKRLIDLLLITIHDATLNAERILNKHGSREFSNENTAPSIHRASHR